MHILRHEERLGGGSVGSTTMMGYGPEDSNFVLQVVYTLENNTSVDATDALQWFQIRSRVVYASLVESNAGESVDVREIMIVSPGNGYTFYVVGEDPDLNVGPLEMVCLNVTDIEKSLKFYTEVLGLLEVDKGDDYMTLSCGYLNTFSLRLQKSNSHTTPSHTINHKSSRYNIALSLSNEEMSDMQTRIAAAKISFTEARDSLFVNDIQTMGQKSTTPAGLLHAIEIEDPDRIRIVMVTDEPFRKLSQVDEAAPQRLEKEMAKAWHKEWFVGQEKP